ncbi:hypothetical protein NDU88_004796 [Pleurodeles waltl]|uniref:Uncharacterized protein n=1 Tax=Pleurodeles waltl TaxID=8319 RepID=A0AAV7WWW0_PLEWA|nr:hypothetical protein NDU88_004796 [Pleurodeles waltl]
MCTTVQLLAVHSTPSRPHAARSTPPTTQIRTQDFCIQAERCEATRVCPRPPLQRVGTSTNDGSWPHPRPHLRLVRFGPRAPPHGLLETPCGQSQLRHPQRRQVSGETCDPPT